MITAGIDEAGRGPVLGPMVMCGISIDDTEAAELAEMGVKDSKLLSPEKREELFPVIKKKVIDYKIESISSQEIDRLIKSGTNLNDIEMQMTAKILNSLDCECAIIDCPSTNIEAYRRELKSLLKRPIELHVEHKADLNHPEVGAASILAKVTRDSEVKKLHEQYDADFGSGYMSDPLTKKFIDENWSKYPELFRRSWSSWKELKSGKDQKKLFDF